jgi:hypothetical protein
LHWLRRPGAEFFVRNSKLLFAILDTAFGDTDLCVSRREVLVASGEGASRRLDRCLGFFELGFYAQGNIDAQDFGLRTCKGDGIVKFSVGFARDTECQSQSFDFICS